MRIPSKTLELRKNKKATFGGKEDIESLALAAQIFNLIRQGYTSYEVAIELGMSTKEVKDITKACMEEFTEDIQEGVADARRIDIARANAIIKQFMPIAMATKVEVSRTNSRGEPYTDEEYKYSLEAGKLVLQAVETRSKIFGYSKTEVNQTNNIINNHAFFLAREASFISELVDSQPVEIPKEITEDPLDIDLVDDVS